MDNKTSGAPYDQVPVEDPEQEQQHKGKRENALSPGNAQEQWSILQSFDLVPHHADLQAVIDAGLDFKREQLEAKLEAYGRNELPKPDLPSYLSLWLNAFKDIMMILLCISMFVLYAVGDVTAATAILIIVFMATHIGAYTEYTSNKAASGTYHPVLFFNIFFGFF
jgi:magnesium-transporting ATPase (P-type)